MLSINISFFMLNLSLKNKYNLKKGFDVIATPCKKKRLNFKSSAKIHHLELMNHRYFLHRLSI